MFLKDFALRLNCAEIEPNPFFIKMNHASLKERFLSQFKATPSLFRSPGRINLIGEHTDYNDGFVMPAAIDKEIIFAIAPSEDSSSVVHAIDMNESVELNLDEVARVEKPAWANYLLGIIDRLSDRGLKMRPFNCIFGGNIPQGAGLSSSAALECGFVYALDAINDLGISRVNMVRMAQWSEHHYAGVKCGIMDQFASMMGKKDHVFMLDCRSLDYQYFPFRLNEYEVVLFDTGVKHSHASSGYNTRREECEEGVRVLKSRIPGVESLRDVRIDVLKAARGQLPGKVYDRCLYVVEEIERVQAAAIDLANADLAAFGTKMTQTHRGLSTLYEVSCPELDFLVAELTANQHILGARMMGGGFGGCVIALVRSSGKEEIVDNMHRKYLNTFAIELKAYEVRITEGVSAIGQDPVVLTTSN